MTRSRTALLALISTAALCLPIGLAGPSSAATNPAPKVIVKAPNPRTGVVTGRIALPPGTAAEGSIRTLQGKNITLSTPSKGTVTIDATSGAFTYTPTLAARHAAARIGASPADRSDSFTVTISDPDSGFHIHGMATVPVLALNSAPRAKVKASSYDPTTGVVTGTVSATDADSDPLTYRTNVPSSKGTVAIDATSGAFTYTPTAAARRGAKGFNGTDSFTITVSDGYGGRINLPVMVHTFRVHTKGD